MATLLADDFNRADSPTSPGSPVAGGPYTVRTGTWGTIGNALYTSVSTAESQMTFPSAANCDFTVTINTNVDAGLITRWVDANNLWLLSNSTGAARLYRRVAGTYVVHVGPYTVPSYPSVFRVVTLNRTISAYVGGVQIGSIEDENADAVPAISGFRSNSTTTVRFEDATVIDTAALSTPAGAVVDLSTAVNGVAQTFAGHVYKGADKKSLDTTVAA